MIKYLSHIKDSAGTGALDSLEYLHIGPVAKSVNWGTSAYFTVPRSYSSEDVEIDIPVPCLMYLTASLGVT